MFAKIFITQKYLQLAQYSGKKHSLCVHRVVKTATKSPFSFATPVEPRSTHQAERYLHNITHHELKLLPV